MQVYIHKPHLVTRLVLPVVWHHISSKTPIIGEAKLALQDLCLVLYDCMGQEFLDNAARMLPHDVLDELLDTVGNFR